MLAGWRKRVAGSLAAAALAAGAVLSAGSAAAAGSISVSTTPIAIAAPGQTGAALNAVTISGATDGAIGSGDTVKLTLVGGATWAAAPSASGTPLIQSMTGTGTATLTLKTGSASQMSDPLKLTGATIDVPTATGPIELDVTDATSTAATYVATVVASTRVAGNDRYATAVALFDQAFGPRSSVVLVSGVNFPDALSAVYLAHQLSTGVLTTDPSTLPSEVASDIATHGVQTVYVVGGTASVSDAVVTQLRALHVSGDPNKAALTVVRVAGSDRYATNSAVDLRVATIAPTVVVATGETFADALAAGPALYATGYPLVLTPRDGLTPDIESTLNSLGATHAIILGGTAAVSAQVESQLVGMGIQVDQRLAGTDRTQTAAQVALWETAGIAAASPYSGLASLGFGTSTIDLMRGDAFADGLAAGAAVGAARAPLLLSTGPSMLGPGAPTFLTKRAVYVNEVQAVGGTAAISDATLAAAVQALS